MTHISDLAAEHCAAASAERARDRAGAWVPDEVPPQLAPICTKCQRGTKAYVCGVCKREDDSNQREDGAA